MFLFSVDEHSNQSINQSINDLFVIKRYIRCDIVMHHCTNRNNQAKKRLR